MGSPALSGIPNDVASTLVNDIHSQLNATRVDRIVAPRTVDELASAVARARSEGKSVSIAGGRHAMGGQQFGEASVLVDTRALDRVLAFDAERGLITAEGGILWPALLHYLDARSTGRHTGVGHRPEADRRRSTEPRWRARVQRARAGPRAQADRRPGRGIRPARRDGQNPHLLTTRAPRALPPGDWRLRAVRHHHPRAAQATAARQGANAWSRSARQPTSWNASSSGSATGTSMATSSSRPTIPATASCAAASSRATGP